MTVFEREVCWSDAAVLAATPRDAAALTSEHFQAVHHPLRVRRRPLEQRSGGTWVTEAAIAEVLREPIRADGYLLLPVVGGPGTGKSHLVRWLHERTMGTQSWECRYIAKNRTSIRRVIQIVMDGLDGPAADAAREALDAAPANTEQPALLADRLLDELAVIVSQDPDEVHRSTDASERQMRAKLQSKLPDILRDPVVRRRFTAPGQVIPRLVGLAQYGRRDGDGLDDGELKVVSADLPLSFDEIGDASKGARDFLARLGSVPVLLDAAVALINEAIPIAVKRVFVSAQIDLIDVFRELRRALFADGKELVLFIEDLTVLHGLELEFLDALIEPPGTGEERLCNLRVVFAVTEGHFRGLDTFRTRCDDAYWFDSSYGQEGVSAQEAVSFVGRYLNASRIQPAELRDHREAVDGSDWVPNACETCEYQPVCHESFGVSEDGFGLYPFTADSLERFVGALSSEQFDPREVVREVVNRLLLRSRVELENNVFPSDELVSRFDRSTQPIDPLAAEVVRDSRALNVLRYWSESHDEGHGEIADGVMSAFGLEQLDRGLKKLQRTPVGAKPSKPTASEVATESAGEGSPLSRGGEERLKAPWKSHYEELKQWSGNQIELGPRATNDLRTLIQEVVVENLDNGPVPISLGAVFKNTQFRHDRHIVIDGSVTAQTPEHAIIIVERSQESAAALQGLILLSEVAGSDYPNADLFRRAAAGYIESWTAKTSSMLMAARDLDQPSEVQALVLSALVSGHCASARSPSEYLAAMFAAPPDAAAAAGSKRSKQWYDLLQQSGEMFDRYRPIVLANYGETRGSGGVRAISAGRLLGVVESFVADFDLRANDPAVDRFMRAVAPAVEAEWKLLTEMCVRSAPQVDLAIDWSVQTTKVLELLAEATKRGRLSERDAQATESLRALANVTPDTANRSLKSAIELISEKPSVMDRMKVLAGPLPDEVGGVDRFVSIATKTIASIENDLADHRTAAGEMDLATVVDGVLRAANRLTSAVDAVTS